MNAKELVESWIRDGKLLGGGQEVLYKHLYLLPDLWRRHGVANKERKALAERIALLEAEMKAAESEDRRERMSRMMGTRTHDLRDDEGEVILPKRYRETRPSILVQKDLDAAKNEEVRLGRMVKGVPEHEPPGKEEILAELRMQIPAARLVGHAIPKIRIP